MELKFYIESGIIESYVLGLVSEAEAEEFQLMRKLYPELETEIEMVERRIERAAFDEAVLPPAEVKGRVMQSFRWEANGAGAGFGGATAEPPPNYTFINIQPKEGDQITVHKNWRLFFIFVVLLAKILLFFAIFYFLKYAQVKEEQKKTGLYYHPSSITISQASK
ncbi:hypothetical protein [Chitinophaga sp. sic0106]|uniref:hypothetical protein n=1 Tax=Chitinophaga sp. sic0106 TaxID=2854785 RepID=UPI001C46B8F9|nr:hypothetical protein [Chitinophaga sp. sic0106]MBV7528844.1 hypothetical protein [Chitinophaga sp. sic0106]